MLSPEWAEEELSNAEDTFRRLFPGGKGMGVWTAEAVTNRSWGGSKNNLSSPDTRIQFKNNAEYHGMEVHAWQYLVTAQYSEASDHFYAAALWREQDAAVIQDCNPGRALDSGHLQAILLCIRLARYSRALYRAQRLGLRYPGPEKFDLDPQFVERRENKAQEQLDKYLTPADATSITGEAEHK